ncbi:hypothetical protein ACERIM_13575 [Natrinema sp. H-ect1]|uniref:hypothetical protein n=1 Tax=Natrinema sp. H-ect1 TaxID=3242700 RepID=UPI00359ED331
MPVIHDYADGSGIYLNSNIDGSFITLQATPAAESFLADLGYTDEDSVSWQLIKPLWEQGHIYTGGSGTTVEAGDVTKKQIDSSSLSGKEKNKLEKFLTDGAESRNVDVPNDIHGFLKKWSPNSDYSKEETAEFLTEAADRDGAIKSVRHLGPHHPINIDEARMSNSGNPVYSISTGGCRWTATDLRWVDHPYDWVFTVCPGDGFTQLFNVSSDGIDWVAVDDRDLQKDDVRNALLVYPDVVWFCDEVPGYHPEVSSWNLAADAPEELPDEFLPAVEHVAAAATSGKREGETEGVILSFDESSGYGRLQTVDYQTVPFSGEEYTDADNELRESLAVSLNIQPHRSREYAFNLEPTTLSDEHLAINGLPQIGEDDSSTAESTASSDTKIPNDVHEILVEWCDDGDGAQAVQDQISERVRKEQALWQSIRDFKTCGRITVRSITITEDGSPRYQIGFQQQGNTDSWEVTHDLSDGPIDLDLKILPSQAPLQEARVADGLIEYWRLAALSEAPDSEAEYRNDPQIRRHRYNLYRSHSVRLFKGFIRDLETVSLAGNNDSKYHIDSLTDPFGNDGIKTKEESSPTD